MIRKRRLRVSIVGVILAFMFGFFLVAIYNQVGSLLADEPVEQVENKDCIDFKSVVLYYVSKAKLGVLPTLYMAGPELIKLLKELEVEVDADEMYSFSNGNGLSFLLLSKNKCVVETIYILNNKTSREA